MPDGADLVLIEDIASRIASAIDSAQNLDRVERARAQQAFLASMADKLGPTMDADEAAKQLAQLLVPQLADWVMVTLLDDDGRVEDIASFHRDSAQQATLDRYTEARRASLVRGPVDRVAR